MSVESRGKGTGGLATCKLWAALPADLSQNVGLHATEPMGPWGLNSGHMHTHWHPGNPAEARYWISHPEQMVGDQGPSQPESLASAS